MRRVLIWALDETHRLTADMRDIIEDPHNEMIFSVASIWEIAIKTRLGRTSFAMRPDEIATTAIATGFAEFGELPLRREAAAMGAELPLHHGDPFDRAIVAQAIAEPIHLYTVDRKLRAYLPPVKVV